MCSQIGRDTGEIGSRFLDIFFDDRNGQIFLLNNAVCVACLIKQNIVVFLTVAVKLITVFRNKDFLFKVHLVDTAIVDCKLCGSTAVKTVEQLGIAEKHRFFILLAGNKVIDIGETKGLCKLIADLKNTVLPNGCNGDIIVNRFRGGIFFFILFEHCFE